MYYIWQLLKGQQAERDRALKEELVEQQQQAAKKRQILQSPKP